MDYTDFHLKIGPRVSENQYSVSARSPSIGESSGVFTQPLTDEQLELFVLKVGLARRGVRGLRSPEWRAAQDFGQKLFRSLFTDEIRAAYLASHNDVVRQGKGLRVKLTLDAPELANYPWEFLYDPSTGQFLSLFEDTPVVRYIELARPILPLTISPPLQILAVASSPKDFAPLDLAQERRNLSKALDTLLQAGLVELDWLASATLDALREQLLKRQYHIFHFIGHGGFDEGEQDGILIFENANQYANRVSGERLAVILGNHRTLRLAILNACEGARTSQQDPFAGTAMTLVRTGNLPAVVAMQFEITDTAAIDFASGFYAAIATGRPVDAAVSDGRQAIFADDNDVEWSTPVLYLRAPDGVIFRVDTSRAAEDAKRIAAEQAEPERLAREKLQAERAEQERTANVRAEQEQPKRMASAPEQSSPVPSRALYTQKRLRLPLLLAEIVWTLGMGFAAIARDWTSNVLIGVILAVLLIGVVFWWGRNALSTTANRILLIGMGVGFFVQCSAIFVIVEPIGDAVYENLSPILALPEASQNFIMTTLRSALFALIGGVTGLAVIAWQMPNAGSGEGV